MNVYALANKVYGIVALVNTKAYLCLRIFATVCAVYTNCKKDFVIGCFVDGNYGLGQQKGFIICESISILSNDKVISTHIYNTVKIKAF